MTSASPARLNPFRSARVERLRFRLEGATRRELLERFARLGRRAALVGPKGSGKTTLLEEIEDELERRGWNVRRWRLTRERPVPSGEAWRRLRTSGPRDLVTVDGAEQLTWWRWRRLRSTSRRAGGLLVTLHRPGRLPSLHEHSTSPELLTDLVAELLDRRRAAALRGELERLFALHRGDVRECLRSLYDRWASWTTGVTPSPAST